MQADLVQWSDEFSVGIPEVDDQHRGLIALVNRVYSAVIEHAPSSEVEEIVHALEHYTIQHFADEERYMVHARYPKFGTHKAVHAQFIQRVAAEKERLLAGFPLDIDIVHFLRDWLVNHILKMDKDFGSYEQQLHAEVREQRAGFFQRLFGTKADGEAVAPASGRRFGAWMRSLFSNETPAAQPLAPAIKRVEEPAAHLGGLDFQGAIEVHMRWKSRFRAALDGTSDEKLDIDVVRRDDRCALGMWLYGEGKTRFEHRPEYVDILMWHAEFHRCAAGILEAVEAGRKEDAMQDLERGPYMLAAIKLRGTLAKLFVSASV